MGLPLLSINAALLRTLCWGRFLASWGAADLTAAYEHHVLPHHALSCLERLRCTVYKKAVLPLCDCVASLLFKVKVVVGKARYHHSAGGKGPCYILALAAAGGTDTWQKVTILFKSSTVTRLP